MDEDQEVRQIYLWLSDKADTTQVWVMKMTNEIFTDYEKYLERYVLPQLTPFISCYKC